MGRLSEGRVAMVEEEQAGMPVSRCAGAERHRADGNEQAGGIVADGGAFEFEFFEAAVAEVGEVVFECGG